MVDAYTPDNIEKGKVYTASQLRHYVESPYKNGHKLFSFHSFDLYADSSKEYKVSDIQKAYIYHKDEETAPKESTIYIIEEAN